MTQKIQVIIFSIVDSKLTILLFRRFDNHSWQPVTGGIEERESVGDAASREVKEETGLVVPLCVIPNIYTFSFTNPPEHWRAGPVTEHVFAFEVSPDFTPVISSEHSEAKWFTVKEALDVSPTDEDRMALDKLKKILNK